MATALLVSMSITALGATFDILPDQSRVRFKVGHSDYARPVTGRFGRLAGRIELDAAAPGTLEISVEIDADSIDTDNEFRDAHLRASFFETEKFPKIQFTATRVSAEENLVEGQLTMKGIVRDVTLAEGTAPYTPRVELKAGMVPVNLIAEIMGVGFDYEMSAAEVARAIVAGHQVLWTRELVLTEPGAP
jgi:hypothetical protein